MTNHKTKGECPKCHKIRLQDGVMYGINPDAVCRCCPDCNPLPNPQCECHTGDYFVEGKIRELRERMLAYHFEVDENREQDKETAELEKWLIAFTCSLAHSIREQTIEEVERDIIYELITHLRNYKRSKKDDE